MLVQLYRILSAIRLKVKRLSQKDIVGLVEELKDAWLAAFKDHTLFKPFAGEGLSEKVSVLEIGVLAAKERLSSLVGKIGAMKHEVQQLFELDFMPSRVRAKFKDAIRTRDASGLIRSHGWEGWLQFALMYRNVSVRTNPKVIVPCTRCKKSGIYHGKECKYCGGDGQITTTIMAYYNANRLCAKCAGTGKISTRVRLHTPIKHILNTDETERKVIGIKDGQPIYAESVRLHYDLQTHEVKRVTCPRCKGKGKSDVKNTWKFPTTFDLIDVIEVVAIMKALYEHSDGIDGGITGHISKEENLPSDAGPGIAEAAAQDLHERMFHQGEMDFFDRENEVGGDINTNPEDRMFSLEKEFDDSIDDLKTYDPEASLILGYKPKFFTRQGVYRGPIELKHIQKWARSITREYSGFVYRRIYAMFDKFDHGEFQRLILDRIHHGAFEWDPEFYWIRDTKKRWDYALGREKANKSSTWARVSIRIDAEIAACLTTQVRDDAAVIEVTLTGDMADDLLLQANCPRPTHKIIFDCFKNGVQYKIPVALRDSDGQWHVCKHVKGGYDVITRSIREDGASVETCCYKAGFRDTLIKHLLQPRWVRVSPRSRGCIWMSYGPVIKKDRTGEVHGVGLPSNCRLVRVDRPVYVRKSKNEEEGE